MTGDELVIEVVSFDSDWQKLDTVEADTIEAALVAARQLVADHFSTLQSTAGARCYVQFFVGDQMILAADDRAIRTAVGV